MKGGPACPYDSVTLVISTSMKTATSPTPASAWNGLLQMPSAAIVDLFVIKSDLTTYKATIKERNFWIDRLVEMASHAPVILVAGNHDAEMDGDLYVFGRAKGTFLA